MTVVIQVENLVKRYQDIIAVDGINFSVHQGQCFGLLGPNGAGKTTSIEIMEGIIDATSGNVLYNGTKTAAEMSDRIGIQFQQTSLQDFLTVKETLSLFSSFYQNALTIEKLVDVCDLSEFLDRDCRKLSGGQRQRLLLALALVNDPDIVFLDEPTTGLDPQARRQFWQLIRNIKAKGKTIVLTTHYMDEAEQLCDHIEIMDKGKIIEQGKPSALLQKHFNEVFIYLPVGNIAEDIIDEQHWLLKDERVEIHSQDVEKTIRLLIDKGVPLNGLHVKSANLDDLFLKLTGHSLKG